MITPQTEISIETKIQRSRFIGFLIPVNESRSVQIQLNRLRNIHPEASQICWSY